MFHSPDHYLKPGQFPELVNLLIRAGLQERAQQGSEDESEWLLVGRRVSTPDLCMWVCMKHRHILSHGLMKQKDTCLKKADNPITMLSCEISLVS